LPIDNVKIDRSFVHVLGHEKAPTAVISAILTLCRALNLTVTGEGIETEEQMMRLSAMGCDKGQGYLLGRPISAEAVETILCNNKLDDSKAA
jgi:EAL domain-containing protein (putative c-di-GMP-specific phosphodiesterase class I)